MFIWIIPLKINQFSEPLDVFTFSAYTGVLIFAKSILNSAFRSTELNVITRTITQDKSDKLIYTLLVPLLTFFYLCYFTFEKTIFCVHTVNNKSVCLPVYQSLR